MAQKEPARLEAGAAVNRDNNFAILHFIGALMVVYGHQWALLGGSPPAWLGNSVSTLGVKMIFVITGFLITQSYLRERSFARYMLRRLIRIYPALIFCVVGTTVLLSAVSTLPLQTYFRWSWQYVVYNLLLNPRYALPGVFETNIYPNAVNGSLWTMPVEVSMYVVVGLGLALLLVCGSRSGDGRTLGRLGGAVYALFVLLVCAADLWNKCSGRVRVIGFWGTDWIAALDVAPYILIGSLYCVLDLKRLCNLQVALVLLILASCVSLPYPEFATMLVVPYFVLSFAFAGRPVFRNWFRSNNIAYGVYLWGFPLQQLALYLLRARAVTASPNRMFLISLVPIVLAAWISHRLVERPIEGFLKKHLLRRRSGAATVK